MEKTPERTDDRTGVTTPSVPADRVVYVMPEEALRARAGDEIDLLRAGQILWQGKWLIIGITALFAVASVAYALSLDRWYKA
ncbi:MAG: Wzz/FepE/Etk N-terminal domain-containing protein, partial [Gammaproteobacteria bacterium]